MTNVLFRIFIFLLPSQFGYHFWPDWALVHGIRVDYLSPTVFATDLLFLFLLMTSFIEKRFKLVLARKNWPLVFGAAFFAFANTAHATSAMPAAYRWLKIFEMVLLILLAKKIKGLSFKKDFLAPLILSAATFSLIGILQFLKGATLGGALYFLGERNFNSLTPGISLVKIAGQDFLRPYSTFSHPNSLAGFLGVVLVFLLTNKEKVFSRIPRFVIFAVILAAFILSFSLGAWIAFAFCLALFLTLKRKRPLKKFAVRLPGFALGTSVLFGLFFSDLGGARGELAKAAVIIFSKNPILGAGLNNFIVALPRVLTLPVAWFLQPVHNLYLLALAETGILGAGTFLFFLTNTLLAAVKAKRTDLFLALCFIVLVGLVDHYFLTLQQNLLLFAVVLGYSLRT